MSKPVHTSSADPFLSGATQHRLAMAMLVLLFLASLPLIQGGTAGAHAPAMRIALDAAPAHALGGNEPRLVSL